MIARNSSKVPDITTPTTISPFFKSFSL